LWIEKVPERAAGVRKWRAAPSGGVSFGNVCGGAAAGACLAVPLGLQGANAVCGNLWLDGLLPEVRVPDSQAFERNPESAIRIQGSCRGAGIASP
jgi:hypothetical protein